MRRAQAESVGIDASDLDTIAGDSGESDKDIIDLTASDEEVTRKRPPSPQPAGPSKVPAPSRVVAKAQGSGATKPSTTAAPKPAAPKLAPPPAEWSCNVCTLINPMSRAACDACAAPRPVKPVTQDGWYCEVCGAGPRELGFWSCLECGVVRTFG